MSRRVHVDVESLREKEGERERSVVRDALRKDAEVQVLIPRLFVYRKQSGDLSSCASREIGRSPIRGGKMGKVRGANDYPLHKFFYRESVKSSRFALEFALG